MARKKSPTLTEAEQRIMKILWEKGEASVRDVTEILNKSRPVAYTTVLTIMGILADKGFASHRKQGRAFIYRPEITRRDAQGRALKQILQQFFDGSPMALAQHLIADEQIDLETIEALQNQLDNEDRATKS